MSTESFKLPFLVSYAYLRNADKKTMDLLHGLVRDGKIELLLDSGAFTALNAGQEIDMQEYVSFLKSNEKMLFGYMQLDKLGDPKQSNENLRVMLDSGLRPIPIHVLGDDERRMNELFDLSDWVALGGFRRPHRGDAPQSYVKRKMQWADGCEKWSCGASIHITGCFCCFLDHVRDGCQKKVRNKGFYCMRARCRRVRVRARHACMGMRGAAQPDAVTCTIHSSGLFDKREHWLAAVLCWG